MSGCVKITKREKFLYKHFRFVHAIRISISFVLTFVILHFANLPDHTWPLITLVVVMGPISFLGSAVPRALERIGGTLAGAILGIIALKIEMFSFAYMLIWCAICMFICGYLTLGKKPYLALLIGITLSVVSSAPAGDVMTAFWRSANIILGAFLAIIFTGLYPQRAYVHWRLKLGCIINRLSKLYQTVNSRNLIEQPCLDKEIQKIVLDIVSLRSLIVAACKECHRSKEEFELIQKTCTNIICILESQAHAHWESRKSHFLIINSSELHESIYMTVNALQDIEDTLELGQLSSIDMTNIKLSDSVSNLHQSLLYDNTDVNNYEASVYGYIWLSLELAKQFEVLKLSVNNILFKK
ncbi:FUSC family protein [Hafnia alvei]|uniref:FUSC family protein n=1 Tax=Hafnia alvei TaxID=569 RepID=UPI0006214A30|nr:FUSC family protein [Hafnia alvei]EDR9719567.1 FUSC family protein [Salmonella enterica subsp. diarizonae]ANC42870.1 hypothetical protein A6V27_20840 [Hafnia alvei]KKI47015.1 hypothetical protein XK86_00770 [Hafnia alvei]MDU7484062.1 FUSC family protein [Hafnia alvei]TBL89822.1 FUSC family protein [Hafnia alvei]